MARIDSPNFKHVLYQTELHPDIIFETKSVLVSLAGFEPATN